MSDKLSVAIIGCGRVASKHLKAIKKLNKKCELKALVDVSEEAPARLLLSSKLDPSGVEIFSVYQAMIDQVKPDIVAVTVPSGLHYAIAAYAMEHGCNLLLEKPMTMSTGESRKMAELSEKTGKKIAMGHIYRYFPLVKILHDDISLGVFGKVTHGTIYARWGHGEDYYGSAAWRGTWKADGGALMNQTIHAIDLLVWLMGSSPVEATAMIAQRLRNIEAEDLGMAVLKMEDGALASVEGTTATSDKDHEAMFTVFCENGVISLGLKKGIPQLNIRNGKGKSLNFKYIRRHIAQFGFGSLLNAVNPHTGIYDDLISSILENRQPLADASSGYRSVDTLMGIYKSARDGVAVKLPLADDFASTDMTGYFK